MSEHIEIETAGHIRTITFARPERKNALNWEMYTAMTESLEQARGDDGVRVVLFRGKGGTFTSGNDLGAFLDDPPATWQENPAFGFIFALANFTKPMVAAIDGYAVGIGATMLFHCDFAYASSDAVFKFPFVNLGIVPEAGASMLLPRSLGRRRASELLMLGEKFDAEVAKDAGLVNDVVAPGEVHERARAIAERLAAMAPQALSRTRHLMREAEQEQLRALMIHEAEWVTEALHGPEVKEALTAFMEKREPDFSKL